MTLHDSDVKDVLRCTTLNHQKKNFPTVFMEDVDALRNNLKQKEDELKRVRDEHDAYRTENKRFKTTSSIIVEELLCPITQQLPVYPVTAEDGRVYERDAIEEWIEEKKEVVCIKRSGSWKR